MIPAVAETIMRDGYVEMPVDEKFLRPRLKRIRRGMERITEDPQLAALFPWRIHQQDHYGKNYAQEVGLVLRTDDEHKWILHETDESGFAEMQEVRDDVELRLFFSALRDLGSMGRENALKIAIAFDEMNKSHKWYNGSFADRIRRGRAITRVLRYLRAFPGTSDAFTHIDRGGITNHWGASHTGLYVYRPDGSRERVNETNDNSVVLFPGRKFAAIMEGKLGRGTPHGVKYERKIDEDRYSFITFVHPASDKDEANWLVARDAEFKAFERTLRL
jgi:hypothetical protein